MMQIGVDLGGTKIEAIALDETSAVLYRHRVATPVGDYLGTLNAIAELVLAIEREFDERGSVGIATPGSLSLRTGLIRNSNSTILNGKPLDRDISRLLKRSVRIENDANCFALSEAIDGAAKDVESVFGVILGTGVGGGLVIRKRVVIGRNRIAGEWATIPCRGRSQMNGLGRPVIGEKPAVSKHLYPGPPSPGISMLRR